MKFRFNREVEITAGTILTLIGYIVFGIWFTIKLSVGQEAMKGEIDQLKTTITNLTTRLDAHIDKGK